MQANATEEQTIQAVIFDYGLVLTGPAHPPAWARMKAVYQADEDSFARGYWKYRHAYDRGDIGGIAYWHAVGGDLDKTLSADDIAELLDADIALWTQPNPPMMDWAVRLQRAGFKTGILSNLGDVMEAGILSHLESFAKFPHYTFSHRLNIAKPERKIYEHAARGLGVVLEQVLFIDDRKENVLGAETAGMQAIQYTRHEEFEAEMRRRGLGWLLEIGSLDS